MRALFAIAIMTSLLLAGCADTSSPVTDVDAADPGTTGTTDEGGLNETIAALPTAVLGMDVLNGTAPLSVDFTIEATNATAWSLDFGEGNATNGTMFPANVTYVFAAGVYNITLAVLGDGGNVTQNATLIVDALEDAEAVLEPFTMTVTMDLPCPGCGDGGTSTCTWRAHGNGAAQDCAWIDFPDELAGQPFTLTGQGLDADMLFWESCNSGVGPKFHGTGDEEGIVPEGMGCVLVWEQLDFMVDLVFTVTPA